MTQLTMKGLLNDWFQLPPGISTVERMSRHSTTWGQLYKYLRTQQFTVLEDEVNEITTLSEINLLIGVGAPNRLYDVVTRRRSQIQLHVLPSRTKFSSFPGGTNPDGSVFG